VRTITKPQFRILLLIYCALIGAIFWAMSQRRSQTPIDVAAEKLRFGMPGLSDVQFTYLMICVLTVSFIAWLIGLISLFFLWRPGIYIFLVSICAIWTVEYVRLGHRAFGLYSAAEMGLEIIIISFALFGPARHLFQRQGSE
jgi:hypothetical protein